MTRDRYDVERLADGLGSIEVAEPVSGLFIYRHSKGLTIEGTFADGSELRIHASLDTRGCGDLAGLLGERLEVVLSEPVVEPVERAVDNTDNVVLMRGLG